MSKAATKGIEVPVDKIRPSPYQPRLTFDVEDLKLEIQRDGLLSPLIVRRRDGFYEIIDGERRWRAVKELGWKTVEVEVRDVDNGKARLSVYKLNKIRKNYTVEEEAKYFKKLAESGMKAYQIGKELGINDTWVRAHLNVFKFPEDIQIAVWEGRLSVSSIQDMEPLIGANIEEATKHAREIYQRKLTRDEAREFISERLEEINKLTIEAAKKAIGTRVPISEVTLEKPEDYERAARVLRGEARKKREEALTLEEKARNALMIGSGSALSMIEKARELGVPVAAFEKRFKEVKAKIADNPDEALTETRQLKADVGRAIKAFKEEEARRRLEEKLRKKIEKEVEERTVQKMLATPEFIEAVKTIPTPVFEKPEEITIPPEEVEAIKRRYEELKKKIDEIIQLPEVRKRGMLFKNWHSHYILAQGLLNAFCPRDGKEKSGKLVWSCCGLPVKEALKIAGDKFEESQKKQD